MQSTARKILRSSTGYRITAPCVSLYSTNTYTMATRRQRFAPLGPTTSSGSSATKLAGIVFDVDGTLCEPQTWMFARMRAVLGIAKTIDILDHVYSLAIKEQSSAMESVCAVECEAMLKMVPQKGLVELMEYLEKKGIQKAICTRNFETPVNYLMMKFLQGKVFSPVVTREFKPPKPDPAGILYIAKNWGLEDGGERLIMVGDSIDDMAAGRRAGAATVLLANDINQELTNHEYTDCVVERLDDLIQILEEGFTEVDRTYANANEP